MTHIFAPRPATVPGGQGVHLEAPLLGLKVSSKQARQISSSGARLKGLKVPAGQGWQILPVGVRKVPGGQSLYLPDFLI